MELANLLVERVILHEVFARPVDKNMLQPDYGLHLEQLDQESLDALRDRVVTAMAHKSKAVPMSIAMDGEGSMIRLVRRIVSGEDEAFIADSGTVALMLASCQTSRKIPGGVLVVISGKYGAPARRIVCVIKAEVHNGFVRSQGAEGRKLQFLKNLMLTAQTKLYKVGLFVEEDGAIQDPASGGWAAYIYDELLSDTNRYEAAAYFYDAFLGLAFPESSARQTQAFHELTKNFIQGMNVEEEEKVTLHNALVTYLKADQSPTVGTAAFAETYLGDPEIKDAYVIYMTQAGFPEMPVKKDLADVIKQLKTRRVTFKGGIKIVGPAEQFRSSVAIESFDGEPAPDGQVPKWTKIVVKDRIANQE